MIKAIETRYKGYRFRSRLEARWAVYFDTIGLTWEYEKEGFDLDGVLYLPDFWLPQVSMWAEVKAVEFSKEELNKACSLANETEHSVLMLIGVPENKAYRAIFPIQWDEPYGDYAITDWYLSRSQLFDCSLGDFNFEGDWELNNAVKAARSARFEHGENR